MSKSASTTVRGKMGKPRREFAHRPHGGNRLGRRFVAATLAVLGVAILMITVAAQAMFIEDHDLRYDGDWPLNTHGGQLGAGQAGMAGGLSHITESALQIQGRGEGRQVKDCNIAYVNGTGGMMAEQVAVILEGE